MRPGRGTARAPRAGRGGRWSRGPGAAPRRPRGAAVREAGRGSGGPASRCPRWRASATSPVRVGAGWSLRRAGGGPGARPRAASKPWKRRAIVRWPRSPGCSRSALHNARSATHAVVGHVQMDGVVARRQGVYDGVDRALAAGERPGQRGRQSQHRAGVGETGREQHRALCGELAAHPVEARRRRSWMSKARRRVSLTPTRTEAMSAPKCERRRGPGAPATSRVCAPLTARLRNIHGGARARPGSVPTARAAESSTAQPRHPPPTGSPDALR